MRVIAGTARGMRLDAPRGTSIRPTSDRLRESLFAVLGVRVSGAEFWDACAGTGAVGIEALSRGARRVVFSDDSRDALAVLRRNLEHTRLTAGTEILATPWRQAAMTLRLRGVSFNFIYFDPPWEDAPWGDFLAVAHTLLAPGGAILVEHPRRVAVAAEPALETVREMRVGEAQVSWFGPAAG